MKRAASLTPADRQDIQALVRTGFDKLGCRFLLLRIEDAARARAWLRGLLPRLTRFDQVGDGKRVPDALQMALSAAGLARLELGADVLRQFAAEFTVSLAGDPSRLRRLGDIGDNAPERWEWGVGDREPHVLLIQYDAPDKVEGSAGALEQDARSNGLSVIHNFATSRSSDTEPFGFRDGLSQPTIDWDDQRASDSKADMEFHNLVAPGEIVLGYPNEYGLYTERPLLKPQVPGAGALPAAVDEPGLHDLGRNGSYLVFRQLHQDVCGFWRWVHQEAGDAGAVALAEAMLGRHMDGKPFTDLGAADIPGVKKKKDEEDYNSFTFRGDPEGRVCPIGAHIRRANPRTGDFPQGRMGWLKKLLALLGLIGTAEQDHIASTRFHRLLRRGRKYGESLPPAAAARPDAQSPDTGLHFICLNANLVRQFEFVQGAWIANAKFAGMSNEQDPMLGNRLPFPGTQPTDRFSRPQKDGPCKVSHAVPQFVHLRGAAYFFLPGLRALDWMLRE